MTYDEIPNRWYGFCPFCGDTGTHTKGEVECSKCGFRYTITDWNDE